MAYRRYLTDGELEAMLEEDDKVNGDNLGSFSSDEDFESSIVIMFLHNIMIRLKIQKVKILQIIVKVILKVIGRKSGIIMIIPQPLIFITWKTTVPNMSLQ